MSEEEIQIIKELSNEKYFGDLPFARYGELIDKLVDLYTKQKEIIEAYENKTKEIKSNADNDLDMGSKEYFIIMNIVKEFEKIGKRD